MSEYFVVGTTFAAPFVSERIEKFVKATSPEKALQSISEKLKDSCGLYAACAYSSADDFHKGKKELAWWLCNHEIEKRKIEIETGASRYRDHGPGDFELDGKRYKVKNPLGGAIQVLED